jgi:hypothetical protein
MRAISSRAGPGALPRPGICLRRSVRQVDSAGLPMAPTHPGPTVGYSRPQGEGSRRNDQPHGRDAGRVPKLRPYQLLRLSQSAEPSRHEPAQATVCPALAYVAVAVVFALAASAGHRGRPRLERTATRPDHQSKTRATGHLVYRNGESVIHDYARSRRGREATKRWTSRPTPRSANGLAVGGLG